MSTAVYKKKKKSKKSIYSWGQGKGTEVRDAKRCQQAIVPLGLNSDRNT